MRNSYLIYSLLFISLALNGCGFGLDKPEGEFGVGSVSMELIDKTRPEVMTRDPSDVRRLMLEFWYPTAQHDQTRFNKYLEILPKKVNSVIGAELSSQSERYPLVIMSHGLAGNRNHSEFLSEALASQGYIVAGIDHALYSGPVAFPGGEFVGSLINMIRFAGPFVKPEQLEDYFAVWVEDCHFVINSIVAINEDPNSAFYHRIDTDRIAMVSHSFGGAMGTQCATENDRVVATINMDGGPTGTVKDSGTTKPFMMIWPGDEANNVDYRFNFGLFKNSPTFYWVSIANSVHGDFTDLNRLVRAGGEPNIIRKQEIILTFVNAFLDRHFLEKDSPLLDGIGLEQFPEIKFGDSTPGIGQVE